MLKHGTGHIVTVSSVFGLAGAAQLGEVVSNFTGWTRADQVRCSRLLCLQARSHGPARITPRRAAVPVRREPFLPLFATYQLRSTLTATLIHPPAPPSSFPVKFARRSSPPSSPPLASSPLSRRLSSLTLLPRLSSLLSTRIRVARSTCLTTRAGCGPPRECRAGRAMGWLG